MSQFIARKDNPTWFIDRLTLYQNANSSPEAIKQNFLIRIAEFELIVDALQRKKKGDPLQHELILGRRGSGKSTLLRRIQIEIDEQANLAEKYVAINLAEEQNAIYRLSDLWFEVLQELAIRFKKTLDLRDFDSFEDEHAYARYLYAEIHRLLTAANKQAVLLLDNLDRILENLNDADHLLRETLLNYNDLQIIGASTRMTEHFWSHSRPFYDFFRRHRLEGLTFEEISQLLNHWGEKMDLPELRDYAIRHRGRVAAIQILTDGLPRALQYFIQVLLHDSDLYGFDYLKKVMDKATPLYQERLNSLTPPQRKIVQEMAFSWEAVPTKTLVEKCRMESKKIAAFLTQLDQYGIVEIIPTNKRNHLYRLSERFFNMWLIVTQGNPDQKRRAKYLTLFLEGWYDGSDMGTLAQKHLAELKQGSIGYDKVTVFSSGLAHSKYISVEEQNALIEDTQQLHANGLGDNKTLVDSDLNQAAEPSVSYIKTNGKMEVRALHGLAILDKNQGKTTEAEHYYLQAIEKGDVNALNNLAVLYFETNQQPKVALAYARDYLAKTGDDSRNENIVLFEIWNGIFEDLSEKIERIIQESKGEGLAWFLTNLLHLSQKQLVLRLFESPEHGKMLQDRYELLYYATRILAQKTEDNLLLRIPPEVMPTVQDIVQKVKEKQAFYAS